MEHGSSYAQARVCEALHPGASAHQVADVIDIVLALVERGLSGDADAYSMYQSLLLEIHMSGDRRTEPARRWIANQIYEVEDRFIEPARNFDRLPAAAFRARVDDATAERSRVRHPLSLYLFEADPTQEQVRYFLHHHWIRSHDFYRLLAEMALRFADIKQASIFYRNLYGEAGGETADRSHPLLLAKLMHFFDIPLEIDFASLLVEEKAYLNNRLRCARHSDVAWGLALLYSIESVSRVNAARIYEMLQRMGVPEEFCEFHRLHGTHDEVDTEELWQVITQLVEDRDFQSTFMRSLTHHYEVNRRYFDVLYQHLPGHAHLKS